MNLVSDTKIKRKEKVELPPVKISVIQRQDLSPVVVFSALQQKFPSVQSFLFESKENSLPTHSFLGIAPIETIRIEQDKIYRTTFSGEEIVSEKPLEFISEYLNRYSQERDEKLVPFTGGIVGYFSYDLVTHLEKIPLNKIYEDSGATALLMQ